MVALGRDTLYQVIGVVARGPDPERVLPAIVELLVEATACHACFIYLREGEVLRMRAASQVYAHAVGHVAAIQVGAIRPLGVAAVALVAIDRRHGRHQGAGQPGFPARAEPELSRL